MYYTVYKITNTINGMIYIGIHQTEDLNDGYMGSGSLIKKAQKKYGIENFKKEILKICNSRQEMIQMESQLVTQEFVTSKQTYNILLGGTCNPKYPKDTEYFNSGEHTKNAISAREKACKVLQEKKEKRIEEYYKNPKLCLHCGNIIPYRSKNKFCSRSCAATVNNTGRVVTSNQREKVSITGKKKRTISNERLVQSLSTANTITEALQRVGLAKHACNYKWANELIEQHNIQNLTSNLSKKQKIGIEEKKRLILNSSIDFTRSGWVKQVSLLLGLSQTNHAGMWVKKHMPKFYSTCYQRKSVDPNHKIKDDS